MSLKVRWIDGFELSGNIQTLVQRRYATSATINNGVGRQGFGRCLRYAQFPGTLTLKMPAAASPTVNTVVIGFGFKFYDIASSELIAVRRSGSTQASIWIVRDSATTAHFELRRGSVTVLASSGSNTINANQWMYLEWRVFVSNSGSTEFRIDQIPLFDGFNVDLQEIASSGIDDVWLNCSTTSLQSEISFDDLYILEGATDTQFLGAITTQPLKAVADANAVFQGPSGAQPTYPYISELTPDDASSFITPISSPGSVNQRYKFPALDTAMVRGEIAGLMVAVHHDDSASASESVQALFYDPDFAITVLGPSVTYNGLPFIETVGGFADNGIVLIERQDVGIIQLGLRSVT